MKDYNDRVLSVFLIEVGVPVEIIAPLNSPKKRFLRLITPDDRYKLNGKFLKINGPQLEMAVCHIPGCACTLHHFTTSPLEAAKATEILRACKLERLKTLHPMDNQPSNFWDDLEKWFKLPAGDEPHGDSATNIGGLGSTDKPKIAWKSIPETESECMAMSIAGKICMGRQPLDAYADG